MPLVAVIKLSKNQVTNSLLFADFDCLRHHGIGRSVGVMTGLRQKGQDGCHVSAVDQFHDADQLFFMIGTDVVTTVEKSSLVFLDLVQSLSVVGEDFPLSHWGIVIENLEIADQVVIQASDLNDHAPFLCASNILARFLRETFPPL